MSVNWIDVSSLSFNTLLLLEWVQLSWFPGWLPENELAIALYANPTIEWYLRHKCPEINPWLDHVMSHVSLHPSPSSKRIRQAEINILYCINDLVVYALNPAIYDEQPFLSWDSNELRMLTDFNRKLVIDVGSGTGRLAFVDAECASAVFAVEPVNNLRLFIRQKAKMQGRTNIFPIDGLIADLPFPDAFVDITMSGHVFGDHPQAEYAEMVRVTKPGGMIILCPGTSMNENIAHEFLLSNGFSYSLFDEPHDGTKRKYWKYI